MAECVLYANEQKIMVHSRTDGSGYVVVEDRFGETVHRSEWRKTTVSARATSVTAPARASGEEPDRG